MYELVLAGKLVKFGWGEWPRPPRCELGHVGLCRVAGPGLVLCSSAAIQSSAAISVSVFGAIGALGTSGIRFVLAALILLAAGRPHLRARTRRGWLAVGALGTAMAVMNVALYQAIERIPLATAVTVEFLGPFLIAVASTRRWREITWVILAAGGVVALMNPSSVSWVGLSFAGLAAAGWALYVRANQAVGEQSAGIGDLALSATVAALLTMPFTIMAAPSLSSGDIWRLTLSGGLGVALAYTLEMQAIRATSAKTVSILFSLDPAVAILAGTILLGQQIDVISIAGLTCVIAAGMGATLDGPAAQREPGTGAPV